MLKDFKKFAMRGNVMDMAVGIIMGGAFGLIVKSFVQDVLMPPIGMLMGGVDFKDLTITLKDKIEATKDASGEAVKEIPAVVIRYGEFLNTIVNFLIVAFSIFMVVKVMNSMKKKEEAAPSAPPANEVLLAEIRDLLKAKS